MGSHIISLHLNHLQWSKTNAACVIQQSDSLEAAVDVLLWFLLVPPLLCPPPLRPRQPPCPPPLAATKDENMRTIIERTTGNFLTFGNKK